MKHRPALSAASALLALSSLLASTNAQEAKPKPDDKPPAKADAAKDKKPEPAKEHLAKTAPFEIVVELDALFTAGKAHPISLAPKAWSDMTVLSVVPHGTQVKKGDKLVTIDLEKLTKAIKDIELDEPAARLAIQMATAEVKALEKAMPVQLEAARRAKRISDEELAYYEQTGHAENLKEAERNMEWAQRSFEYAKEELEQLEKMYAADDLTEETEEIILRRARKDFDRSKENLRLAKMETERQIRVQIPRGRIEKKAANEVGALTYEGAVFTLPRTLEQKRFALDKAQRVRADALRKLRDMKADLASFDVRAPADGVVYYGRLDKGKLATAATAAKKLVPGGKLSSRDVFMTVAETGGLGLSATVPEEKLAHLNRGLTGTAIPVSNPSLKIPVKVNAVSYVPAAFTANLSADIDNSKLYPGMKAKVKLDVAKFDKAITVPNELLDGDSVWLAGKDGKKEQRKVKTGPTDGKVTVILSGLKDGEKIVAK